MKKLPLQLPEEVVELQKKTYDFKLNPNFLPIEIRKDEQYNEQITITNNGTEDLEINISVSFPKQFIFPEKESFVLESGKSEIINFNIYVPEREESDVYIGRILFISENVEKFVDVVLDVRDRKPLFDIKTTVINKKVVPGGKVKANIVILNLGDLKNIDVNLEYEIQDFNGNSYTLKKESFAIEDSYTNRIY